MFTRTRILLFLFALMALLLISAPSATAQEAAREPRNVSDNMPPPWAQRKAALKMRAIKDAALSGTELAPVTQVGKEFVQTSITGQGLIWTVLAQFGDNINATYGGDVGPSRNAIPKPDRNVDNTTIWVNDFSRDHYKNLLFDKATGANSMTNWYREQSSGLYSVDGKVTDWVNVPYNEANYGSNYCGDIVCARTWLFVRDSLNSWYGQQLSVGKTPAEIDAYLSQFDTWDRYDYDLDGNFDEPDGYIDHFQSVHAGEGEETGGGAQGTDAIWSHRWYVFSNLFGVAGPIVGGNPNLFGGLQIGQSSYWVGDYTIEPENGGLGVFVHEFGHDLDLPDLYDTSGNTGGAENSTGFWTTWSSGSYGNTGKAKDGIGDQPVQASAYEKLFLGWSKWKATTFGADRGFTLNPAEAQGANLQMLMIPLPNKQVASSVGAPYAGTYFYYSDKGNDLDNSMSMSFTLPAGSPSLAAKIRYDIEQDWDYGYVSVNGTNIHTNLSTNTDPNGQNQGEGITGSSGGAWVDLTADLSAYAGQTVTIAFRYWTDVAAVENGYSLDDIAITGQAVDGGETDPGWTYAGFLRTDGNILNSFFNAYFIENRQYQLYDQYLQTGPYNFGFLDNPALGNWVEHFPYQDGMLVWYYDESFTDNNVGDHCLDGRCGGLYLPVDAHPQLLLRPDNGLVWRPRIQGYDSTFSLDMTDAFCLHANSVEGCLPSRKAKKQFNDKTDYWFPPNPTIGHNGWASVPLPKQGVKVKIKSQDPDGTYKIKVNFTAP